MTLSVAKKELWTPPQVKVNVHNHFLAELFDAKTGRKIKEVEAENVVLNQARVQLALDGGLTPNNAIGSVGTNIMGSCQVGSGTSPPSPSNTQLAQVRAHAGYALSSQVADPVSVELTAGAWFHRKKYYFSETVANFSLTEVGLAEGPGQTPGAGGSFNTTNPGHQLATRALFRDSNGDPISVTKDSSQVMVVTATVYLTRGNVAENMRLLNNFFVKQVNGSASNGHSYGDWYLGNGGSVNNADTGLTGTQQARKSSGGQVLNDKNRVFWDSTTSQWFYPVQGSRPSGKTMVTAYAQDWDTNEGNVTFSEVLLRTISNSSSTGAVGDSIVHLVFPCGTIGGTQFTKTSTSKLRQYLEISW